MEPGGDTLLAQAPAPRRLLRALRLRMQRQLADAAGRGILPAIWAQLLGEAHRFAGTDGPRWKDLPWEALLHLGTIRDALPVLRGQLPAEHGAGLLRLVDVAERLARRPGSDEQPGPLPLELALSGPVIDLLAQLGNEVPEPVRPRAARLVHAHLEAAVAAGGDSAAELDDAAELPDTLRSWLGDDRRGDLFDHVVGSLALLGTHLAARHEEFLAEHARRQPDAVAEPVESPWVSGALARSRPHLLLRLAGLFYLGVGLTTDGRTEDVGRRPRSTPGSSSPLGGDDFDDDLEGVREHDLRQSNHLPMLPLGNNQSNPALGPFAALLAADPARGLRLIGAVVDAATAARAGLQADHPLLEDEPPSVALTLSTPPDVWRFTGPNAVWLSHRRTSVGPGPALSALMALRAWASGQIREGARAATVRDTVLGAGTSLAFPAVALSVLVENIDAVHDELDPFLVHPLVWHLEIERQVSESGGTALDVPEATRLSWTMSDVAMHLVLRGDATRRRQLGQLGVALLGNVAQLSGVDGSLVVRRWASELDVTHYVAQEHDGGIAVSVAYPPELAVGLASSGGAGAARRWPDAKGRSAARRRGRPGRCGRVVARRRRALRPGGRRRPVRAGGRAQRRRSGSRRRRGGRRAGRGRRSPGGRGATAGRREARRRMGTAAARRRAGKRRRRAGR
jgi:hypothetical protein